MSDYDIDDYGVDDFELAQDDMDGGLFDSYEDDGSRPAGEGSIYDQPTKFEMEPEEELTDDDDIDQLLETMTEDEVENLMVNSLGRFANQWDGMVDHMIFFEPWYVQYKQDEHYDRYWKDHSWEKLRHRKLKAEKWREDPEKSRLVQRQKNKKHYYKNVEQAREAARKRMAAYRARKRAEKEAQKNG
jgi:hypothetical protein